MDCPSCPVGPGCRGELAPRLCELQRTQPAMRAMLLRMAGLDPALPHDPTISYAPPPPAPIFEGKLRSTFASAPTGKIRVGLLTPNLNQGGGERWNIELIKMTAAAVQWVGMVCLDPVEKTNAAMLAETSSWVPIQFGKAAIADLASQCDVLVSWIIEDLASLGLGPTAPPIVWVDHFPHSVPYDDITQRCLANVARIVAVSEVCLPGVPPSWQSKTSVLWNAVDPDRLVSRRSKALMRGLWGVPATAKVAGFYARMALEKRPDAMVRLASSLPDDWHVVMVGDSKPYPDEVAYLNRMMGQLSPEVRSRLHLLPPDPAAGDVLGSFDVLVNPAQIESFGLTLAEALWVGTPAVSTPFGMAKLHPELNYPIKLDDTGPNLAAAVQAAYAGGPKPGSQSFARARFSPERFGAEWLSLIASVAGRPLALPSLASQATSLLTAIAAHGAGGFEMATDTIQENRQEICGTCPFLAEGDRCQRCGCHLSVKRKWVTAHCPEGKW